MAVRVDPQLLANYLRSPNGPILRHMLVLGEDVKQRTIRSLRPGFPREFLGPQIVKRVDMVTAGRHAGPHVYIGASRTRTRPHPIDGNPLLVFHWAKAGRVVFLRHVDHPGSNLGPYLEAKMLDALRASLNAGGR